MTTHRNFYDDAEFEVTFADEALVAPLGTEHPLSEEARTAKLTTALKSALPLVVEALPRGRWDAFIDEGEWACAVADCENGDHCCDGEHQLLTRESQPRRDSVFVRPQTMANYESIWDAEVNTRHGHTGQMLEQAIVTDGDGGEFTPETVVNDLGVLLAVFRLFVQQGRL